MRPVYRTGVSLLSGERFLYIQSTNIFYYLIFAWPCIIDINNIDNQLDAKIIIIPVSSTCFGQLFCPSSGCCRQHRRYIIPQAVTQQSSAPEDGQNNYPKLVELTGIIIIVASSSLSILFILHSIFLRLAKQSQFNPYPEILENMVSS